ncbi:MAG: hypothetical protein NTW87_33355, partial [Planctomycetota bacterium]|nr:hypothetical protein [Planctomycetota bacterium]
PQEAKSPEARRARWRAHRDALAATFTESGLTAALALGASDMRRAPYLDAMAKAGALLLVNPDTRPTSFFPVGNEPHEISGMSQRMILTAQANGRYPNFGGFCFGWDTTGYAVGGRKGLMTYWGWGDKTEALRNYIARQDQFKMAEFTRRARLQPVADSEYIAYLLSIGHPEFAPAIDLPTKLWLEQAARHIQHAAVRHGQYFPSAYESLDIHYQSAWNDQVGGPDYAYQWLFVAGLLDMHRNTRPTWISNAFGAVHGLSQVPGKFTRVAAHGLAWGGSGIGFACEGFSNLLGGMNAASAWEKIKDQPAGQDVLAGRDFLHRFAALAIEGRGDHGVGILFSRSQLSRQHVAMGYGVPAYKAFVALTRLGYTPRFVTEEELGANPVRDVKALIVIGQTAPLTDYGAAGIASFAAAGGRVFVDGSCTASVPRAEKLDLTFPFTMPGKPHNWAAPNIVAGDNDTLLYARWHGELARAFSHALGDTGRVPFRSEKGPDTEVTLTQLDGGADAHFIVAVNDSHVHNQADWHQVREKLTATKALTADTAVYDCTEEKAVSGADFVCDLSTTTARIFAVLPRPMQTIDVSATQTVGAGGDLVVHVEFLGEGQKRLAAVLPFHIAVLRPDGAVHQDFYRATERDGAFSMAVPIPANAPLGAWSVTVRSQLNGDVAALP